MLSTFCSFYAWQLRHLFLFVLFFTFHQILSFFHLDLWRLPRLLALYYYVMGPLTFVRLINIDSVSDKSSIMFVRHVKLDVDVNLVWKARQVCQVWHVCQTANRVKYDRTYTIIMKVTFYSIKLKTFLKLRSNHDIFRERTKLKSF